MFENVITNTSKIIIGNTDRIKLALAAIISEGSILIEDYPGSGKTTFAKALTLNLGLNFISLLALLVDKVPLFGLFLSLPSILILALGKYLFKILA